MTGDDAIRVMQSVQARIVEREKDITATELKLALTIALDALRTAHGTNGDTTAKIFRARRIATEALKAA